MPAYPKHYLLRRVMRALLFRNWIPAEASWQSRLRERIVRFEFPEIGPYYSQGGQDRFIHELVLPELHFGHFVEIGANDGVTLSNCLYFEKRVRLEGGLRGAQRRRVCPAQSRPHRSLHSSLHRRRAWGCALSRDRGG